MNSPIQQFQDILKSFETAMLVTRTSIGELRARPMAVARIDSDSDIWFVTDAQSGKVDELQTNPHVCVVMQKDGKFLSLTGEATLHDDRNLLARMWNDRWKDWFPKGLQDANLLVLQVISNQGEFWDVGRLSGMEYIFEAGRASAVETSRANPNHGHVQL